MKNKKIIVFCMVAILTIFQFSIFTTKSKAETKTIEEGDITATLDTETGVLTISGTGEISDNLANSIRFLVRNQDYKVKKVVMGEGITYAPCQVFISLEGLEEIEVNEKNEEYCSVDGNLYNKDKTEFLIWPCGKSGNFVVPDSVKKIEDYSFFAAEKLTGVTIPNTVETIGEYAFYECVSLKKVVIPDSVTEIERGAFSNCYGLEEVELPEGINSIEAETFKNCFGLRYIELSDKVTSIGTDAFSAVPLIPLFNGDTSGTVKHEVNPLKIVIPNSVTTISENAFRKIDFDNNVVDTTIYCKSDSAIKQYVDGNESNRKFFDYVIDDDAPTITKLTQDGSNIVIEATDNDGCGIKKKGYSLDGENWTDSNKIAVDKSGTYTVYVRDGLYNVSSKEITVDITEKKEDDDEGSKEDKKSKSDDTNNKSTEDDTQAKTIIPQTGAKFPFVALILAVGVGVIYIKYKNLKF